MTRPFASRQETGREISLASVEDVARPVAAKVRLRFGWLMRPNAARRHLRSSKWQFHSR
jgi:hypothetical protein